MYRIANLKSRVEHFSAKDLLIANKFQRVNVGGLVSYFARKSGSIVMVWFDHNTREWVAYLVDEQGNQIGAGVRERDVFDIICAGSRMFSDPNEYLYPSFQLLTSEGN